ncbi:hypothetical protein QR46_2034 [Giardia duodenalis assemblage B]|uniref:Uncharacterized protein n=1 Tax=Giardia duodenalis assemblage B TaxID=1394984 RepID=A0A132NV54_GIAIN|nr:hypothetical protein QR46_2034 [Giardia intestinalis assemblage B]
MNTIRADMFYPVGSALCRSALAIQHQQLQMKAKQTNTAASTPSCHRFTETQGSLPPFVSDSNGRETSLFDNIDDDLSLEQQFALLLGISMHTVHITDTYKVLPRASVASQTAAEVTSDQFESHCEAFLQRLGVASETVQQPDNVKPFTETSTERSSNARLILPQAYGSGEQCLEHHGLHALEPLLESL